MSAVARKKRGPRAASRRKPAAGRNGRVGVSARVKAATVRRKRTRSGNGQLDAAGLMAEAVAARRASHSPYSRFPVGAALLTESGRVYHGCNVENASYGLTCCAERTALFTAVSEGERRFAAIAVTARSGEGAPPCGACRQVLAEFSPDLWVYWRDQRGHLLKRRLGELLPEQFRFRKRGGKAS